MLAEKERERERENVGLALFTKTSAQSSNRCQQVSSYKRAGGALARNPAKGTRTKIDSIVESAGADGWPAVSRSINSGTDDGRL